MKKAEEKEALIKELEKKMIYSNGRIGLPTSYQIGWNNALIDVINLIKQRDNQ